MYCGRLDKIITERKRDGGACFPRGGGRTVMAELEGIRTDGHLSATLPAVLPRVFSLNEKLDS